MTNLIIMKLRGCRTSFLTISKMRIMNYFSLLDSIFEIVRPKQHGRVVLYFEILLHTE